MRCIGLGRYFQEKYAAEVEDISFGVSINAIKTRLLKDKLILIYDKINKDITVLPEFIHINQLLEGDFYLTLFNDLVNNYVVNIENSNLKEAFSYSGRMIQALNQLRDALVKSKVDREKMYLLDNMIKSIQDTIWKESKRILNIHNLRGILIDIPELQNIINKIVPTWDYGPGKNPTKGLLHKRPKRENASSLIKRLLEEEKDENENL